MKSESRENEQNSFADRLEQLVKASKAGDFNVRLDDGGLSCEEADTVRLLNTVIGNYHAAVEYELMKYKLTSDALGIALWDMDVIVSDPVNRTNKFTWSQEFRRMLGFDDENDFPNLLNSWSDRLHPEDKERTLAAFAAHINDYTGQAPYDVEYRLMLKNGQYRHYHAFGTTLRNSGGIPIRVAGALEDIEEKTRMRETMEYRNKLLNALGEMDIALLSHKYDIFDDVLNASLEPVAEANGLDSIVIFNLVDTGSDRRLRQEYRWNNADGRMITFPEDRKDLPKHPALDNWIDILSNGGVINKYLGIMSKDEVDFLSIFGVKSMLMVPAITSEGLWGAVAFLDVQNERSFDNDSIVFMSTAARLCANAIIRNEKTENEKIAMNALEQCEKMMRALADTAIMFLSRRDDTFEDMMTAGIKLIADTADIDRISLWKNYEESGEPRTAQIYRWDRVAGGTTTPTAGLDFSYERTAPHWAEILGKGESVNSPVNQLPAAWPENVIMRQFGVVSVFVTPVFIDKAFWGFVMFEDRENERYFDDSSADMMHMAAFLCANTTMRAEMDRELIAAKEFAEQSSHYKSAFLATMSHEIRTPMNAILGVAEIQLQNESLPKDTAEALGKIYESGNLLMGIINDILDLSKIEAGKMEILPVKYDIPSLINDSAQLNRLRYSSKPIEFYLEVDAKTPLNMLGDELRIKQILNNLLSNAYKYTDKGKVTLSVTAEYENAEVDFEVTVIFRVSDTGQGMTEEQVKKLFDEYTRFNTEANRTAIGTGLGMSITRRLVELMDGEILVESEPGKGSVFTVRLPQRRTDSLVCGSEMSERLRTFCFQSRLITKKTQILREYMPYGSVLVVDDVESNLYVAKGMLLPYGLQIETASSGFEAIDKIKDGKEYDIVFMDHMMPKMDGVETVNIMRSMGYRNAIVALTANALVGQAKIFSENGFDGYISKPIDSREMNAILNEFIRDKQTPQVVEAARREQLEKEIVKKEASVPSDNKAAPSELEKYFVIDAEKAVGLLDGIYSKINTLDDAGINTYTVTVHGMKSALANIGEKSLSDAAFKLEKAGKERNFAVMSDGTPAFVDALRSLIDKLKANPETDIEKISSEESSYLREKLLNIKTACEAYNPNAATKEMNNLTEKAWPRPINDALDEINLYLLLSEFEKAADTAANIADKM